MPRISHGSVISLDKLVGARTQGAPFNATLPTAIADPRELTRFGYMFPELQNPDDLLPTGAATVAALVKLGASMRSTTETSSKIPAAYTYFGQFIDHDITLEVVSDNLFSFADPNLVPLTRATVASSLLNARSGSLDLDSVYNAPAPRNGDQMLLGTVTKLTTPGIPNLRPPGKDDFNDLPRDGRSQTPSLDRAARIGDPRNDENTIVAQLHTAFLRAHNVLARGQTFEVAQKNLRQHYQWLVVHDFLDRICDPEIAACVRNQNEFFTPSSYDFFMPLEFAAAAYRFGHSMVRRAYEFNLNFNSSGDPGTFEATLGLLFVFTALSGGLGNSDTLPENWIIEWERLIGDAGQRTSLLDTLLVEPLFELKLHGADLPFELRSLAVRNLLRGYALRVPTGQAVARALRIRAMTPDEIVAASDPGQTDALKEGGFLDRTPLWFYVLAEAKHAGAGNRLGPVGSTLVAEVLVGLARRSDASILADPTWRPTLGANGTFVLQDLLRLAGVLA